MKLSVIREGGRFHALISVAVVSSQSPVCGKALVFAIGMFIMLSANAVTYTVAAGESVTKSGITETSATVKDGDGTLVLNGANTLKRMQVKAGTLHISGGSTAISDSTATATTSGSQVFEQLSGAQGTLIDGGATVTLSGGKYAITESGTLTITNATLDATGLTSHFMNAFRGTPGNDGCKIVIDDGGVMKATYLRPTGAPTQGESQYQDKVGVELKTGGKLYLTQFWTDNVSRYGRIWFDGGTLYPQDGVIRIFNEGNSREPWKNGQLVPTVMKGGCHIVDGFGNVVYPAFRSGVGEGETDGGLHLTLNSNNTFYLFAKGSDFNGGTYLNGTVAGAVIGVNATWSDDSTFGALPSVPSTNIWITGKEVSIYNQEGDFVIQPNRTIHVSSGTGFRAYVRDPEDRLFITSEIKGEPVGGLDYPTNTYFEARGDTQGTVVLGPGEGRTNDIGRLVVKGSLEITNGVTRIACGPTAKATETEGLLFLAGKTATGYSDSKGRMAVKKGGVLYAPQAGTRYVTVRDYGQADICGGVVDMPNIEWLNAFETEARTTIRDGGVLSVPKFRVAQKVTGNPVVVNLATNGLLCVQNISLDAKQSQKPEVTFLFDGGAVQSANGVNPMISSNDDEIWDKVTFAIGPGGAVFDTLNGSNIHWHRPLVKTGENDGGVIARGGKSVVLYGALDYTGPTVSEDGTNLQLRKGDDQLPSGSHVVLRNGGIVSFCKYDGGTVAANHTRTKATLGGVEGSGTLSYSRNITINGTIAPSIGGTITINETCTFANATLEISGNKTNCGKVLFKQSQDISGITLSIKDVEALDSKAKKGVYKIFEANAAVTGEFKLAAGWPDGWVVKYADDRKSASIYHPDGLMLIVW